MAGEAADSIAEKVRSACAWVAGRARSVRIDEDVIGAYAAALPSEVEALPPDPATELIEGDREARAAFVLCLDAINFGSGWWPTIRKRPGRSGYFTIAAGLTERFRESGPWPAAELAAIGSAEIAGVLGQDPEHPLMADYAAALRDVGEHVEREHGGRFGAVIEAANGSALVLADLLAELARLRRRFQLRGPRRSLSSSAPRSPPRTSTRAGRSPTAARPRPAHRLRRQPRPPGAPRRRRAAPRSRLWSERIEAGELLEHGSPEEVELRACAVHAIELLAAITPLSPAEIDAVLWNRGAAERYKSRPRPRSRNTAY